MLRTLCALRALSPAPQAARKINVAKFRAGRVQFLLVTDVAARGIDIPLLDNVVNYGGWVGAPGQAAGQPASPPGMLSET